MISIHQAKYSLLYKKKTSFIFSLFIIYTIISFSCNILQAQLKNELKVSPEITNKGGAYFNMTIPKNGSNSPLINVNFSSTPEFSSILPRGWTIPIIDSCAILDAEENPLVLLPTGEIVSPLKNEEIGWRYEVEGDELKVTNEEVEAIFEKGRIKRFSNSKEISIWDTLPRGAGWVIRTNDKSVRFDMLVKGIDQELKIANSENGTPIIVKFTKPQFVDEIPQTKTAHLQEMVNSIECSKGFVKFEPINDCGSNLTGFASIDDCSEKNKIVWESVTGTCKSINGLVIDIIDSPPTGYITNSPRIEGSNDKGVSVIQHASYHNPTTNVRIHELGDNTIRKEYFIITNKVLKCKKYQIIADGEVVKECRAFFDENGESLKEDSGSYKRILSNGL